MKICILKTCLVSNVQVNRISKHSYHVILYHNYSLGIKKKKKNVITTLQSTKDTHHVYKDFLKAADFYFTSVG